jgi:hypothetical protein
MDMDVRAKHPILKQQGTFFLGLIRPSYSLHRITEAFGTDSCAVDHHADAQSIVCSKNTSIVIKPHLLGQGHDIQVITLLSAIICSISTSIGTSD